MINSDNSSYSLLIQILHINNNNTISLSLYLEESLHRLGYFQSDYLP
jgi:hypothetical protein